MRRVVAWLAGFTWIVGGCAAPPGVVTLPPGHPADPASEASPFVPPPNPFADVVPAGGEPDPSAAAPHSGQGGHRP